MRVLNPLDPERKNVITLTIATFAEKCVFADKQTLWCAVPRDLGSSGSMPDQYLSAEFNSSDRLVSVDLIKNEASEIFNEQDFDMNNLIATKDKAYLFFVNRKDGKLWSLKMR